MFNWADNFPESYLQYSRKHFLEIIAIYSLCKWVILFVKINTSLYTCCGVGSFLDLGDSKNSVCMSPCVHFVFVSILILSQDWKMTAPAGGITFVFKVGMRGGFDVDHIDQSCISGMTQTQIGYHLLKEAGS